MVRITNPVLWADYPDNDVIRVGDAFYMVSTSMHSMPGGPIMKSYDLQHWELVSYMFDRLNEKEGNNLENGQNIYGQGSWAASLRHIGDWFYCLLNSNDDHHAYMFRTKNPEQSGWEKYSLPEFLHDPSILVDDDGRKYVIYGNHEIHIREFNDDLLSLKEEVPDRILFKTESRNIGLKAEGCHAYKIDGHYYLLFIEWPTTGHARRREVCYRFDSFEGPFEHKIILDDDMGYHNAGVAQGAIFTLPDEKNWAAVMFQDHGAVGRIPYVLPVEWVDGWPMLGTDGRVPEEFSLPLVDRSGILDDKEVILRSDIMTAADFKAGGKSLISVSDNFSRLPGKMRDLADTRHLWQWNHNPDDTFWSLSERPGYLRLINGHICEHGITQARNTLTQRTFGPKCSAVTHVELAGMNPGDCCGLVALQGQFGIVGVRVGEDGRKCAVMCVNGGNYAEQVVEELAFESDDIYLKIDFDFEDNHDKVEMFISFDKCSWHKLGDTLQMSYTLDHFMGYRIGLYSYGTVSTGGYADFEYFEIG